MENKYNSLSMLRMIMCMRDTTNVTGVIDAEHVVFCIFTRFSRKGQQYFKILDSPSKEGEKKKRGVLKSCMPIFKDNSNLIFSKITIFSIGKCSVATKIFCCAFSDSDFLFVFSKYWRQMTYLIALKTLITAYVNGSGFHTDSHKVLL